MPELPEVETTRRGISPLLISKVVHGGTIHNDRLRYKVRSDLIEKLCGQKLLQIGRRGKYLIMYFRDGSLLVHLGMSGSIRVSDGTLERRKHDHIEILFENYLFRYHDPRRFGAFIWTENDPSKHKLFENLGVEPLTHDFNGQFLYRKTRKTQGPIKNALMNNRLVVGVGNIYANEALFLAGINPKRSTNNISEVRYENLANKIKVVLSEAIRDGGTTLRDFYNNEGKAGYFKVKLKIYGRKGLPCKVCGDPIKVVILGQRSTYYCLNCQT